MKLRLVEEDNTSEKKHTIKNLRLDWTKAEDRKAIINKTESGMYGSTDADGTGILVFLTKGRDMEVWKSTNKGWTEVSKYDANGDLEYVDHKPY